MSRRTEGFLSYYNKFKHKIFNYFLYRVNFDRKCAEDLTSEVFLKAFKVFDQFDKSRSFQSWIYTIARNHLINYYKVANREISLTGFENVFCQADAKIEDKLELERIFKLIDRLDPGDKDILLLRYAQSLTNAEIAAILDKEEGAVRTQLSRSLVKLRLFLNQ